PLVRHFLEKAGRPDAAVSPPYMVGLAHFGWPYNVRELESAVRLSIALADGAVELDLVHLPETIRQSLHGHGAPRGDPTMPGLAIPEVAGSNRGAPTEAALRE